MSCDETAKEEPKEVAQKISQAVAPVWQRRAEVVFQVVLGVMHPDVMRKIRLRRLPEERTEHPRDVLIHPTPAAV